VRPFYRNPVFWIGLGILCFAIAYAVVGDPWTPTQQVFFGAANIPPLGSDGRCTGFPNGLGRWQWGQCCIDHDAGGTDVDLLACIIKAIPLWAAPLAVGGVFTMWFCRPAYNVLQRLGWAK